MDATEFAVSVSLKDSSGKVCSVAAGGEEAVLIDTKSICLNEMYLRVVGTGELAQMFRLPS